MIILVACFRLVLAACCLVLEQLPDCAQKVPWKGGRQPETAFLCEWVWQVLEHQAPSTGVQSPVCFHADPWLLHFRSDVEKPSEKLDRRKFPLHIKPRVQICTSGRKCRSAHQTESVDLHIRPKMQICKWGRTCRSAHKAESADLHIGPKV